MSTRARTARDRHPSTAEQLIAALLPDFTAPSHTTRSVPLPALPAPGPPRRHDPDGLLLGTARLDRSGRLHERSLLRALGWGPGHQLTIDTCDDMTVISSAAGGRHRVDDRGALALPATARRMCAITIGPPVVLIADVPEQALLAVPAVTATLLLAMHYRTRIGGSDAR
jgi:hypothetical protein